MAIGVGERLPEGALLRVGEGMPEPVQTGAFFAGRRVVLFGVPGAFSDLCTTAHVPSYMRSLSRLLARGVEEVACLAVNDPFALGAWGQATGATAAGITLLADPTGDWVEALGQSFDAPPIGLYRRCTRFSALVEDGVVKVWQEEAHHATCEATAGEAMLEALG